MLCLCMYVCVCVCVCVMCKYLCNEFFLALYVSRNNVAFNIDFLFFEFLDLKLMIQGLKILFYRQCTL